MPTDVRERFAMTGATTPVRQESSPTVSCLPNFELMSLVHKGQTTEIWKVRDRRDGKFRVLKTPVRELRHDHAVRQRLHDEVGVLRKAAGEFVVRVIDEQLDGPLLYLLLEWLDGQPLECQLTRGSRFPCHDALWIARQCLQGLHDLVVAGYAHGDLQPRHIFVCQNGAIKLIGTSHALADDHPLPDLANPSWLLTGGTPLTSSIESERYSQRVETELFALGTLLYRLLAGEWPSVGEFQSDASQLPCLDRKRLRQLAPDVPREVAEFVHTLLERSARRRGHGLSALIHAVVSLEIQFLSTAV
jgi:serine/threonine protein kinase